MEVTLHALHINVDPFTRQCNVDELTENKLEDEMIIDGIIIACLINDPSPYPSEDVFISPDNATLSHLQRELTATSL